MSPIWRGMTVVGMLAIIACRARVPSGPPSTLDRPADPILLDGAELPWTGEIAPEQLTAWRWNDGWSQVPVQVDERLEQMFSTIYGGQLSGDASALVYADPQTHTGADPDPSLDADDEIVLRARDAGARAPASAAPPRHTVGAGWSLRLVDPLDQGTGYLYLFVTDGNHDPAASVQDVTYDVRFVDAEGVAGSYLSRYDFGPASAQGPRRHPEDTTVTTGHYQRHWRFRNDADRLSIGDSNAVDLIARHDYWVSPGDCSRHIGTFDAGRGAFIANRVGPIRAIRSYLGANSAPLAQTDVFYYAAREDTVQYVRAHERDTGGIFYTVHSDAALGMRWMSDTYPDGFVMDGEPDAVGDAPMRWSMVTGAAGTTFIAYTIEHNLDLPPEAIKTWYLDARDHDLEHCGACDGDCVLAHSEASPALLGAFGPWLDAPMPNTDPRLPDYAGHLVLSSTRYVRPQPASADDANKWDAQARQAISVFMTTWPPSAGAR